MKRLPNLTHERLLEVLDYNPATGALTWKIAGSNRIKVGDVAGAFHKPSGGRYVAIDGDRYMAHRLAWFHVHGEWPKDDLKALNGDYSDLRIENLKDIPRVEIAHKRGAPNTNTSGFLGVSKSQKVGKWQAAITWNYRQINLGSNFDTPEEAFEIYSLAEGRFKASNSDEERAAIVSDLRLLKRQRAAWKHLHRDGGTTEWASFEDFAKNITEIPVKRYAMVPVDVAKPIGPGNFRWSLPIDAEHNSLADRKSYVRESRRANSDLHRAKHLKKMYGADIGYERQLLVEQKGLCAICEKPEQLARGNEIRRLSLDHNHTTKALRGLLCGNCNMAVGYFCDDPSIMRKAAAYIEKYADQAPNVVPFKTGDTS